jgi:hypothetical protein
MFGTIFAKAKIARHGSPRVVPNIKVKTMTISKSSFHRLSVATQIFGTLVAGSVLIAGMDAANAHGSGGGGGGGSHSMGGSNGGMNNSRGSGNFWSGKSSGNSMSGQKKPVFVNTIHPIISKGSGSKHESRRELRRELKKELRKDIARLKKLEHCKVSGKCGGVIAKQPIGHPIETKPIGQGTGTTTTAGGPGTTMGGGTTGGGTKPPVLSDPGYGQPTPTTGGGSTGGGGGPASPGKIDPPSPGTTIKQF